MASEKLVHLGPMQRVRPTYCLSPSISHSCHAGKLEESTFEMIRERDVLGPTDGRIDAFLGDAARTVPGHDVGDATLWYVLAYERL